MEDQVQQLRDEGIAAARAQQHALARPSRAGDAPRSKRAVEGLLYVAPERFFAADFASADAQACSRRLFVVDEAHCV